jgi:hypothetical protein
MKDDESDGPEVVFILGPIDILGIAFVGAVRMRERWAMR